MPLHHARGRGPAVSAPAIVSPWDDAPFGDLRWRGGQAGHRRAVVVSRRWLVGHAGGWSPQEGLLMHGPSMDPTPGRRRGVVRLRGTGVLSVLRRRRRDC